jgi:very-short-patch-repair endonuclease
MPHAVVSERQRSKAKQLRPAMTRAETLLWKHLKANRMDGVGIRRQTPIGNYIADFVCFSSKLVIELDGESHDFDERQKKDERRDAFFAAEGFQVLRFTNDQVMTNLEGVVEIIRQATSPGTRGSPPFLTLPHKGGGNTSTDQSNSTDKSRGTQP